MQGPWLTFQPHSILRLLPFFFLGLLLFLEGIFYARSGRRGWFFITDFSGAEKLLLNNNQRYHP
jgi:hypothetical protein